MMNTTTNLVLFYSNNNLIVTTQKIATTFLDSLSKHFEDCFFVEVTHDFIKNDIKQINDKSKGSTKKGLSNNDIDKIREIWIDLINGNSKETKLTILYRNPKERFVSGLVTDYFIDNIFQFVFCTNDYTNDTYANPFLLETLKSYKIDSKLIDTFINEFYEIVHELAIEMSEFDLDHQALYKFIDNLENNSDYNRIYEIIINTIVNHNIIKKSNFKKNTHSTPYMIYAYHLKNLVSNSNVLNIEQENLLNYIQKTTDKIIPESEISYNDKKMLIKPIKKILQKNETFIGLLDELLFDDMFIYEYFNSLRRGPEDEQ